MRRGNGGRSGMARAGVQSPPPTIGRALARAGGQGAPATMGKALAVAGLRGAPATMGKALARARGQGAPAMVEKALAVEGVRGALATVKGGNGGRSGMTLIEVLMASVILGLTLVGLLQGMSQCLKAFSVARRTEEMQNVLSLGEIAHPMKVKDDPVSDLEVTPDGSLRDGYTYERTCDEDEDEDSLYLVKIRVAYEGGGPGAELIVERYVYHAE